MSDSARRNFAGILLAALLLLLALRLAGTETLRETLSQKSATYQAMTTPRGPNNPGPIPLVGPAWTLSYATAALALSGAAALVAGISRRRAAQFALLAGILLLLGISAAHAANRFAAVIGAADIAASLSAAWGVAVLCDDAALGKRGRQAAIAAIVAMLAMGAGKALMQYLIEYPDTAQYLHEHREEALRNAGIDPQDEVQTKLFLSRVNAREVSGFGLFANVFAAQMIPLAGLVAGLLMAGVRQRKLPAAAARPAPRETREKPMLEYAGHKTRGGGDTQVPLHAVAWVLAGVVLLAAVAVVPMTDSNGGMAAGILCVIAVVIAGLFGERIAARRRVWAIAALGLAAAGAAGLISYGVMRHGLPTKSLLFRWQYWSGSIPMVRQFPAWGVGLNNFGDYYTRFKSPSWPEDVKDPHNFFVRLAAEAGLPATIGLALWLGWWLWGALGAPRRSEQVRAEFSIPALLAAGAGALLWALLRMLGLPYSDFELIMSFIYGGFGLLSFSAVLYLLCHLEEKGIDASRQVAVAGVLSALAMLLYDQVNMALVTGSCATLFWMLLAVGDASRGSDPAKPPRLPGSVSGLMALIGALATLLFWLLPRGAGAIDPAPREYGYVMHFNHLAEDLDRKDQAAAAGDAARALEALDSAIALSPLNGELYNQRILLNRLLARQNLPSQPTADDIRKLFALDAANARPRVDQAMPDSDLPGNERIAALEQALQFDAALAPDEPKRLSDAQKAAIRDKISELKGRH